MKMYASFYYFYFYFTRNCEGGKLRIKFQLMVRY